MIEIFSNVVVSQAVQKKFNYKTFLCLFFLSHQNINSNTTDFPSNPQTATETPFRTSIMTENRIFIMNLWCGSKKTFFLFCFTILSSDAAGLILIFVNNLNQMLMGSCGAKLRSFVNKLAGKNYNLEFNGLEKCFECEEEGKEQLRTRC